MANAEVGKYLNNNFVATYQKVGTFTINNGQKQGGNVASYFCTPDGQVIHALAGPANADVLLREARWVAETYKLALLEGGKNVIRQKMFFRKAHAERLKNEHGLVVEPVTFDPVIEQDPKSALTYKDPTGRPLAPLLPPPPIDGPDVTFRAKQDLAAKAAGAMPVVDRRGNQWALPAQGRVEQILAAHGNVKIEKVYGTVFENILGEKISTKPVEVVSPFPWVKEEAATPDVRLLKGSLEQK